MRKRLRKKWHKEVLPDLVDLSQRSFWRARLFQASLGESYPVDSDHLDGVPARLAGAICARHLRFEIAKVAPEETEPWLSEGGLIVFRFRAREFPSVALYSGNNPEVI
jgi:hypothetical protein